MLGLVCRSLAVRGAGCWKVAATAAVRSGRTLVAPQLTRKALCSTQAAQKLVGFLKEEIEAEKQLAKEQFEGGDSVPGFEVRPDEAEVKLVKQFGAETVTVTFNANHSVDAEERAEQMAEEGADESSPMVSKPQFTVEVEKGQQKLAFECQIVDDAGGEEGDAAASPLAFQVDEVYLYSGDMSEKVYAVSGSIVDGQLYDHLVGYLAERSIDAEFVEHLVRFATHYEHAQYVMLLQKIRDFATR